MWSEKNWRETIEIGQLNGKNQHGHADKKKLFFHHEQLLHRQPNNVQIISHLPVPDAAGDLNYNWTKSEQHKLEKMLNNGNAITWGVVSFVGDRVQPEFGILWQFRCPSRCRKMGNCPGTAGSLIGLFFTCSLRWPKLADPVSDIEYLQISTFTIFIDDHRRWSWSGTKNSKQEHPDFNEAWRAKLLACSCWNIWVLEGLTQRSFHILRQHPPTAAANIGQWCLDGGIGNYQKLNMNQTNPNDTVHNNVNFN